MPMKVKPDTSKPRPQVPSAIELQETLSRVSANLRRGDVRAAQQYALRLAKQLHFRGLLPDTLELGE